MIHNIIIWISTNYVESLAATIGMLSIYFGIKEKPIFWIFATLNAFLFVFVYFNAKIYAIMMLQFYYISISVYGFYYWIKGGKKDKENKVLISKIKLKYAVIAAICFILVYTILSFILNTYTDSTIPYVDSFISTASIFAAFFMMKKYIENWYIWIISDVVAIITLYTQELYGATILQIIYFIFAIVGFFEWKKSFELQEKKSLQ